MAYWTHKNLLEEAWDYLLSLSADFYLFQEARPSAKILNDKNHLIWDEIGARRNWGSGIYSNKFNFQEEVIKTNFGGVIAVANAEALSMKLTFISMYGLLTEGNVINNLNGIVNDLSELLKEVDARNIILGGDLNASIQWDEKQNNNNHRDFFNRLKSFGLEDCFKLSKKPFPVQTLRKAGNETSWQNDYIFMSKSISKYLVECEVIDNEGVRRYSDHNPVIITLEL